MSTQQHKNTLKLPRVNIFLHRPVLIGLTAVFIVILAGTNSAKALTYQRDPSVSLIPSGTDVTITVSGVDFSSDCSDVAGNSWGLYILRSDASNPNGAYTSPSQLISNQDKTYTFSNLPSGDYAEVGAVCYTFGPSGTDSFTFFHNQRSNMVLESGNPVFTVTPLTITTTSLSQPRVAVAYSQTLQAIDGSTPYSWSIASGSLPTGLSLNSSTGEISGSPTTEGIFNFTVQVTDSSFWYATRNFSLTVLPEIIIESIPLLTHQVNVSYSRLLEATGGVLPYIWSVSSGSLPYGLSLNSSTGEVFGTPTAVGTSNFTIQLTDNDNKSVTQAFRFIIYSYQRDPSASSISTGADVTITTQGIDFSAVCQHDIYQWNSWGLYIKRSDAVNPGGVYTSPSQNIEDKNLTWTFSNLPSGDYAEVGAVCYTFGPSGTDSFVWWQNQRANILLESGSPAFGMIPLNITTTSLLSVTTGVGYSQTTQTTSGTTPFIWTITSGSLPIGLFLGSSTGIISGTPTTVGTYNFTVQVIDVNSQSDIQALSIVVNAAPVITTTSLSAATVNGAYLKTLLVTGGTTPLSWSIASGSLPTGLSLGSSTGVISGTPTVAGTYNFVVRVSDAYSVTDTRALSILVNIAPTITRNNLPDVKVGHSYSQIVTTSGGTTPLVWSISSGSLPPGLSINSSTGVISGTPTTVGTYNFTVQATDVNNVSGTKNFSIQVKP